MHVNRHSSLILTCSNKLLWIYVLMKNKNVDFEDSPEFLCEHFRHLSCDVHPFLVQITARGCLSWVSESNMYLLPKLLSLGCVSSLVASPYIWSFASVYYLAMSVSEVIIHPDAMKWMHYTQNKQFSSSLAKPFPLFLYSPVSVSVLCR